MSALAALVIAMPLGILIHELGHGMVALYLSRRPVDIHVGVGGPAVRVNVRGLRLTLSARQALLGIGGWARFDRSELTAVSLLLIALAGPAASAAGALVTGALLGGRPETSFVGDLLSAVTFGGWGLCLLNLVPFRIPMRGGRRMCSDGSVALGALAHIAKHRTARLTPAPYDPADDEKALATLHRLVRHRVADSAQIDLLGALSEIAGHRPDLAAAVDRRIAAALRHARGATSEQRRALISAAMDPGWRG